MKILNLLIVALFVSSLALVSSCGDDKKSDDKDAKNEKNEAGKDAEDADNTALENEDIIQFSDFLCEMKALQNNLMKAYEGGDEAVIAEITAELETKAAEMQEMSQKMELKYEDNLEASKAAQKKMVDILSECEHYTTEEIEIMKKQFASEE
ncbi:MAG: hypothetical protein JXR58_13350 [Bacteroidales bacterium]|nr:hypothetical protein [Bacteroidales bacterium]